MDVATLVTIIGLIFSILTALVGLYSRSKVQQVTIELTEKFEFRIKEEKANYAIKIKDLNQKIESIEKIARSEYATKEELRNMIKHIDDRFDDLKHALKTSNS